MHFTSIEASYLNKFYIFAGESIMEAVKLGVGLNFALFTKKIGKLIPVY